MKLEFYWCNTGGHDKVWGYFIAEDHLYNFWAKRNEKIFFQQQPLGAEKMFKTRAKTKINKGYRRIEPEMINEVWPDFFEDGQTQLFFTKMAGEFTYQPHLR